MKISIAMATYNGAKYIREQLESLASQTVKPSELVICDDGSTDKTLEIIEDFAKFSPFIVHLHRNPKRMNYASNFLKAASLCTGDIIAYCDQDDVWLSNKLEKCSTPFLDPKVVLVVHDNTLVNEELKELNNSRLRPVSKSRIANSLNTNPFLLFYGHTMIFSRILLNFIPQERPKSLLGDYPQSHEEIVYLFANVLGRIAFLKESFCLYRQCSNASGMFKEGNAIQKSLKTGGLDYQQHAKVFCAYATYLRDLAPKYELDIQEKLILAAIFYDQVSQSLKCRSSLYQATKSYEKFSRFTAMLLRNTYRSRNQAGLGAKSLLKDFSEVVLGGIKA